MNLPYANDLNYWKTSKTSAGGWIDKCTDEIVKHSAQFLLTQN